MGDDGEKSIAGVRWSDDSQHYAVFIYLFHFIWMTHQFDFFTICRFMGSQTNKGGGSGSR